MKKLLLLMMICCIAFTQQSCLTTRSSVGNFTKENPTTEYAKARQIWLFWGLVPLGRADVKTPENGDCQIVTRFTFGDVLISALTGGLVTTYTIKVKVNEKSHESQ